MLWKCVAGGGVARYSFPCYLRLPPSPRGKLVPLPVLAWVPVSVVASLEQVASPPAPAATALVQALLSLCHLLSLLTGAHLLTALTSPNHVHVAASGALLQIQVFVTCVKGF